MTKRRMGVLEGPIPPDTDEVEYVDASAWLLPEDERPSEADIERSRRITDRINARQRIQGEAVTGAEFTYSDGTVKIGNRVVKVGPRAVLDQDGRLTGMTPEPDTGSQDRF